MKFLGNLSQALSIKNLLKRYTSRFAKKKKNKENDNNNDSYCHAKKKYVSGTGILFTRHLHMKRDTPMFNEI